MTAIDFKKRRDKKLLELKLTLFSISFRVIAFPERPKLAAVYTFPPPTLPIAPNLPPSVIHAGAATVT